MTRSLGGKGHIGLKLLYPLQDQGRVLATFVVLHKSQENVRGIFMKETHYYHLTSLLLRKVPQRGKGLNQGQEW